jgi:copper chaperone CopZ
VIEMPTVKVLITTEPDSENDVLEELKKIEGVFEVTIGGTGITAKVKADTMDKLKEIVTWQIRRLDKVRCVTVKVEDF